MKVAGQRGSGADGQQRRHGRSRLGRNSIYCPAAPLPRCPACPSSTSATEAPSSSACRSTRCSTLPLPPAWGSGRSIPMSAASSAARTATRGIRIGGRWRAGRRASRSVGLSCSIVPCLPPEEAFEKEILVKTDVAEVLARTLNPARLAGHSLVIGTATDPYQPAERQFRLTRRILEVLRSYHGLSIGIITKSSLVTRDLDVLQALVQSPRGYRQYLARHRRRAARAAARASLAGTGGTASGASPAHRRVASMPGFWWRRSSRE